MGSSVLAPTAKPGDDLLFHRLSDSTIGAVRFHGRVRDGIGWVTDAMATKLWGRRVCGTRNRCEYRAVFYHTATTLRRSDRQADRWSDLSLMVELSSANRA